MGSRIGVKFGK
jgi:hypothetical protein